MKKELFADTFDLTDLPITQKQNILDRFFGILQQVFLGSKTEEQRYRNELIETRANNFTLHLYKNEQGKDVGFCTLMRYEITLENKSITVFRSAAGLLPEYRHMLTTLPGGLLYVLKYKLTHLWKDMVYFGIYVHPSSYHLLYKYYPQIFPSLKKPTPSSINDLVAYLKKYFNLRPALSESELCVYDGWITIDKDSALMQKKKKQYPDVAYFHEKNPKFTEGDGLIVVIPVKIIYILRSLVTVFFKKMVKLK